MKVVNRWLKTGLLGVCALSVPLSCAADTLSHIRETQTITIAHREASVPFSYLTESKTPLGYSVDICLKLVDAIKKELKLPQLKVNYLLVTTSNRIPAIVEGKADMECGSTTNNAERRKQVSFTIPHFFATTRMIVRTDSGIKNWPDLKDKKSRHHQKHHDCQIIGRPRQSTQSESAAAGRQRSCRVIWHD